MKNKVTKNKTMLSSKLLGNNASMRFSNKSTKAFSLLELSIVILIASILITGALSFSSANSDREKIEITKQRMETIYKAIGKYVNENGKIPCPALITRIKSTDTNYGIAAVMSSNTCQDIPRAAVEHAVIQYGMVPVKTLGLPIEFGEDGFGNKISYVINGVFARKLGESSNNFSVYATYGVALTVREITADGGENDVNTTVILAIISHGKNGSGAYPANSGTRNPLPSDPDEYKNVLIGATGDIFYVNSSQRSDTFDDIMIFKNREQLVADFNAHSKILCPEITVGSAATLRQPLSGAPFNNNTNFSWEAASYGEIRASTTPCINAGATFNKGPSYPTRRCEAFGNWGPIINNCLN